MLLDCMIPFLSKHTKEKRRAPQFRLKAAHVLWATAKCRHPGSATRAGEPARRLRPNKVWSCAGYSEMLTQCVAAAAGSKRREPMAHGAGQRRKAEVAQFRLKAARVLRATAKCRHPGSPEAKCSSPAEVLALQGRRLFRTRELAAGARQRRKAEGLLKYTKNYKSRCEARWEKPSLSSCGIAFK
jgi:hypothetical protein